MQLILLHNGQAICNSSNLYEQLKIKHKFTPKLIGISESTKNNKQFLDLPFLLNGYQVRYLLENKLFHIQSKIVEDLNLKYIKNSNNLKYQVFCQLKKDFYLLDGHKFGGDFLAYEKDPQQNHAKYLVFIQSKKNMQIQQLTQNNYNQMTRLSEVCKKQCLFCYLNTDKKLKFYVLQRQKEAIRKRNKNQEKIQEDMNKMQNTIIKYEKKTVKYKHKLIEKFSQIN